MSEKRQRITSQSISFFLFQPRFCLHWIDLEASWIEKWICLLIIITHQLKLTIHCLCKWCTCARGSCRRTLRDFAVTRTRKIKFIKRKKTNKPSVLGGKWNFWDSTSLPKILYQSRRSLFLPYYLPVIFSAYLLINTCSNIFRDPNCLSKLHSTSSERLFPDYRLSLLYYSINWKQENKYTFQ